MFKKLSLCALVYLMHGQRWCIRKHNPPPGVCDPYLGNPGSATDFLLNINESTRKILSRKLSDKLFLVPITPLNPGPGIPTKTYKQLLGGTKHTDSMYWSIQHCVLKCPWIQSQYLCASISHLAGLMLRISCISWRLGCGLEWCLEKMTDHQLIYKHLWQWPCYSHVASSNNILEEQVPFIVPCMFDIYTVTCMK